MPYSIRHQQLRVARTRLHEAGVPESQLRPADLLAWAPEQWAL